MAPEILYLAKNSCQLNVKVKSNTLIIRHQKSLAQVIDARKIESMWKSRIKGSRLQVERRPKIKICTEIEKEIWRKNLEVPKMCNKLVPKTINEITNQVKRRVQWSIFSRKASSIKKRIKTWDWEKHRKMIVIWMLLKCSIKISSLK